MLQVGWDFRLNTTILGPRLDPATSSLAFSVNLPSKAAGNSKIKLRFKDDNKSLFIHGKLVDTIHTIEELRIIPRAGYSSTSPDTTKLLASKHIDNYTYNMNKSREWVANAMQIAFPDKICIPEMYDALWRTWICNRTGEGIIPPASWGERFSRYIQTQTLLHEEAAIREYMWKRSRELRDPYDLRLAIEEEDPLLNEMDQVSNFVSCSGQWCFNRRFFRSVAGRFGWAPDKARAGDQICVFYGGDYPFVLRESGNGCHEIIGDGYLHGLMDGEAMDCALEEREFRLV